MLDSLVGTSLSRIVLIAATFVSLSSLPARADLLLHYDFNDTSSDDYSSRSHLTA